MLQFYSCVSLTIYLFRGVVCQKHDIMGDSKDERQILPSATLLGHSSWSLRCAVSADGLTAVSGDGKPSARQWSLEGPYVSKSFGEERLAIRQCALSADGSHAAVAGASDGDVVALYDTNNGERLFELPSPGRGLLSSGCALTPDASTLAASFRTSSRTKGALRVVRWHKDAASIAKVDRPFSIWQCEISEDGRRAAFKFWHGTTAGVEVVDPWTRHTVRRFAMPPSEWAFAMDASASIIVTASEWALRICSVNDSSFVHSLPGYTFSQFAHCSISANGDYVVAPLRDHKFGVWHVRSTSLLYILSGHTDRTNGCDVSKDGSRVVTCSNDRTLRVWDLPLQGKPGNNTETLGKEGTDLLRYMQLMLDGRRRFSINETFLSNALRPLSIVNITDLIYAHTILLIAKRTWDISGVDNSVEAHAKAAYSSVNGKLHNKSDVFAAQVIMLHAERVGMISRGFSSQIAPYLKPTKTLVQKFRETVLSAWNQVATLPKKGDQKNLDSMLASCLDSFHKEIQNVFSSEHIMLFTSISACTLLYHPSIIGSRKLDFNELPPKMTLQDMIPKIYRKLPISAADSELSRVEAIIPLDISSPFLLKRILLLESIAKLPSESRKNVLSGITKSSFKNIETIETYLDDVANKKLHKQSSLINESCTVGSNVSNSSVESRKPPPSMKKADSQASVRSLSMASVKSDRMSEVKGSGEVVGVWEADACRNEKNISKLEKIFNGDESAKEVEKSETVEDESIDRSIISDQTNEEIIAEIDVINLINDETRNYNLVASDKLEMNSSKEIVPDEKILHKFDGDDAEEDATLDSKKNISDVNNIEANVKEMVNQMTENTYQSTEADKVKEILPEENNTEGAMMNFQSKIEPLFEPLNSIKQTIGTDFGNRLDTNQNPISASSTPIPPIHGISLAFENRVSGEIRQEEHEIKKVVPVFSVQDNESVEEKKTKDILGDSLEYPANDSEIFQARRATNLESEAISNAINTENENETEAQKKTKNKSNKRMKLKKNLLSFAKGAKNSFIVKREK